MKERIAGSITVIILLSYVLMLLLQGQGLEKIEDYNQQKDVIVVENSETVPPSISKWVIQIEAFEDYEQAKELAKELENKRFNSFISTKNIAGKEIYRVRIRSRDSDELIETTTKRLSRNNFSYEILPPGQQ
tara:strand:+ start:4108 stop:4503 length:396 start_codon:yes stop_codon:yes gene_type:complete